MLRAGSLLTRQPQGPAQIDRGNPLTVGLVWFTADPLMSLRAARPSSVGQVFASAAPVVTGPSFAIGSLSDLTILSFGVLNGTANSGNEQAGARVGSNNVRTEAFTGNAQVRASVQYSDFTSATIAPTAHGVNVNGGALALGLRHIRGATNGLQVFVNGRVLASANAQNKALVASVTNAEAHWAQASGNQGFLTGFNGIWSRALSDAEIASISANPWQLFKSPRSDWRIFDVATGAGSKTLSPDLFTNSQAFYSPTVGLGAVTLSPGLFSNAQTFYAHTLTQAGGAQTLSPSLYTNSQTFYGGSVGVGTVTLSPSLFTNSEAFYSATITQGGAPQTLSPSLLTNSQTFYGPTATVGAVTLLPGLFTNAQTFYSASLSGGIPLVRQKGLRKTRYTPGRVPAQQSELVRFLQSELERLNDALESPFTHQLLEVLSVEPARKREGMVALADGSSWNPGSGKGVYVYYSGTWNRLG